MAKIERRPIPNLLRHLPVPYPIRDPSLLQSATQSTDFLLSGLGPIVPPF